MARRDEHVISFRADDDMLNLLIRFAEQAGIYNVQDKANLSAAVKVLISMALESGGETQTAAVTAYRAARSSILNDVRIQLDTVLESLAKDLV